MSTSDAAAASANNGVSDDAVDNAAIRNLFANVRATVSPDTMVPINLHRYLDVIESLTSTALGETKTFRDSLEAKYGTDRSAWPPEMYAAVKDYSKIMAGVIKSSGNLMFALLNQTIEVMEQRAAHLEELHQRISDTRGYVQAATQARTNVVANRVAPLGLSRMTLIDLRYEAAKRDLDQSGTRKTLIERIEAFCNQPSGAN